VQIETWFSAKLPPAETTSREGWRYTKVFERKARGVTNPGDPAGDCEQDGGQPPCEVAKEWHLKVI
jgi:hypothetical protein